MRRKSTAVVFNRRPCDFDVTAPTLALILALSFAVLSAHPARAATAYDFTFLSIDGGTLPLADYAGRPVLVVNTASQCGFTPQYAGLERLWTKYRDRGLLVLGVPSNDFGGQEPGSASDIKAFTEHQYAIDFPLTAKVVVRGAAAHPFFSWAKREAGVEPGWNFTKILIGPDGHVAASFPSSVEPEDPELVHAIESFLPEGAMSRPASGSPTFPGLIQ